MVGRRNAGTRFYRLVFAIAGGLVFGASVAHYAAGRIGLAMFDLGLIVLIALHLVVFRFPRRLVYRVSTVLVSIALPAVTVVAFDRAVSPSSWVWSTAGALSAIGILGSMSLAMILGHWYLVVRGMPIDPLKRLTFATLAGVIVRAAVIIATITSIAEGGLSYGSPLHQVMVGDGIFFWMRVGWGIFVPLMLYPMIWGTVKIRSTMAATGILYVGVVGVVIGEVLAVWLSATRHLPL